jgi:CHAD domain-containing protein
MRRALKRPSRRVCSVHDAALLLVGGAIRALREGADDRNIHAARKACKRIRAGLRLLRKSIGERTYARENRTLRDATKPLTIIRDAFALRQTLRKLPAHSATLDRILDTDYRRTRSRIERGGMKAALGRLRQAYTRLAARPALEPELKSVALGLKRTYGAGRKSLAKARSLDDEVLHEWRKQTRYLLNQLELLKAVFNTKFKKMRRHADKLAGILGNDHDLAVLLAKLRGYKECDRALLKQIRTRRRNLQARALGIGKQLYRHSAKQVQSEVERKLLALRAVN